MFVSVIRDSNSAEFTQNLLLGSNSKATEKLVLVKFIGRLSSLSGVITCYWVSFQSSCLIIALNFKAEYARMKNNKMSDRIPPGKVLKVSSPSKLSGIGCPNTS